MYKKRLFSAHHTHRILFFPLKMTMSLLCSVCVAVSRREYLNYPLTETKCERHKEIKNSYIFGLRRTTAIKYGLLHCMLVA